MSNPFLRPTDEQNPFLRPSEERLTIREPTAEELETSEVGRLEYLKNSALLGTSDTLVLGEAFLDTFVIDPLKALVTGNVSLGAESTLPTFGENISRLSESAASITGADPYMTAPDLMTKIGGGGIRMATDPFGYVGKPAIAAKEAITEGYKSLEKVLAPAAPVTSRATMLTSAGVSAEIGGEVGASLEEGLTGEDTGTGRAIGSLTGAVGAVPAAAPARFVISNVTEKGKDVVKNVANKYKNVKADSSELNFELSSGAAKQLLKDIADGTSEQNIEQIINNFNRIAPKIGVENVPLFVALSDNPAVKSEYNRLIRKDPNFRKLVDNEAKIIAAAIDVNASRIFGTRYADIGVPGDINNQISSKLSGLRQQRELIDDRIFKLSEGLEPSVTRQQIGEKIQNLVKAREAIAKNEVSPLYDSVIKQATEAGAVMPSDAVSSVYQFVKANRLEDLFGKGTSIDRDVLSKLKPKKVKTGATPATGDYFMGTFRPASPGTTVTQAPELTFKQVDSMKRAINAELSKPLSADTRRRLLEFQSVFDEARLAIPGDYSDRLRAIDTLYYQKVGIPFDKKGITELTAKEYAEQVAPVITKNKQAFDDFINVAGDEGYNIAKNSLYAELYEKGVRDGILNPKALDQLMFKRREVIDAIPGFRDELNYLKADAGELFLKRDQLDTAYKQEQTKVAQNFLNTSDVKNKYASVAGGVNYTKLVTDMMGNRGFLEKVYKDLDAVSPTIKKSVESSLRAELFDVASKDPRGAFAYITDPKNKTSVERIMGKGYTEAAKGLSMLADAVNRADTSHLAYVNAQKDYESIGGVKYSYLASQLRDRISSVQQKAIRIFSKVVDVNRGGSADEALKKLMLDREGLKKLQSISKEVQSSKTKEITADQLNRAKNVLGEVIPTYIYSGVKMATLPQQQELQMEQQPKVLY